MTVFSGRYSKMTVHDSPDVSNDMSRCGGQPDDDDVWPCGYTTTIRIQGSETEELAAYSDTAR
jgi:hypothetical protein